MKLCWFAVPLAAWALVGCAPDRSLDSLVPRDALAVALVDHPGDLVRTLSPPLNGLPLESLDGERPWAAIVVPGIPPGFRLLLALGRDRDRWVRLRDWATTRGGLTVEQVGTYAVLSTPGLPAATSLAAGQRFDLDRVRAGGQPINLYINLAQVWADPSVPSELLAPLSLVPGLKDQLAGVRVGLGARDHAVVVTLTTDWRPGASWARTLGTWTGAPIGPWTSAPVRDGVALSVSLPPQAWAAGASLVGEGALRLRWAALAPFLGPRARVSAVPRADGSWAWSAAVESKDPQAVRQGLKTLVASGDVQRQFGSWALDPDTPLIYQDKVDPVAGVATTVSLGNQKVLVGYGADRVALAGGDGALDRLRLELRPTAGPGMGDLPSQALAAGSATVDGLAVTNTLALGSDGNLTLRLRVDQENLAQWIQGLSLVAH